MKNKRGFTLAELLIVVAIIGVLVAISIPIFTTQLEKSRQAVDLANARSIEAVFAAAANDGTIQFTSNLSDGRWQSGGSIWVYVSRDDKVVSYIGTRSQSSKGKDATINGSTDDSAVLNLLTQAGLSSDGLKVKSKNDESGWAWYKVFLTREADGIYRTGVISGISSNANSTSDPANIHNKGSSQYADGSSNMEKAFAGTK